MVKFSFDTELYAIWEDYLKKFLQLNPSFSSSLGLRDYDHEMTDMSLEVINKRLSLYRSFLEKLNTLKLSDNKKEIADFEIFKLDLESRIFQIETMKTYSWNPLLYIFTIGSSINVLLDRDKQDTDTRATAIISRVIQIPQLIQQARSNLVETPEIHRKTAINNTQGVVSFLDGRVKKFLSDHNYIDNESEEAIDKAKNALEGFVSHLETAYLEKIKEHRAGDELYNKGLYFTLGSKLSTDEIYRRVIKEKERVYSEIIQLSKELVKENHWKDDEGKIPEKENEIAKLAFKKVSDNKIDIDNMIEIIREDVEELETFITNHGDIVDLDPTKVLEIEYTPAWMRGFAMAFLNSPGPFETDKNARYYLSPPQPHWDEKAIDSYLREYNREMIKVLTIHEAIPGHFVQLYWHNNKCQSPIRKILKNGPFIEGWAVLTEKIMMECGFQEGNKALRLQRLKFYIRTVLNTIIDQGIHLRAMTEEEAVDLMLNIGFQEETEARAKWTRAMLSTWQLCTYFVGFQELNDIYSENKKKHKQKEVLNEMLRHGSPPVFVLKELMQL